jgi:putative membrane protein
MRISPRIDLAPGDRKFINAAASSLALEQEAARLALERSSNQAVRTFASEVVARNKSAGAELASLAERKAASDALGMSPQHAEILTSLAGTKGVAFDRAFAVQLGLQAPEDLVITFNRIARESSDGDMRAYAEKLLPSLRTHQREAVQMARAAGAPRHRVQAAQDLLPPDPARDAAKDAAKDAAQREGSTRSDESR